MTIKARRRNGSGGIRPEPDSAYAAQASKALPIAKAMNGGYQ
jgi:hypothetical protein